MFIKFRGDLQFCCIIITLSLGSHIANATASDQLVLGHELCLHIGSSDGKKADESSKAQVQECRERRRSSARLHGPRQHAPAGAVPFPMRKRMEQTPSSTPSRFSLHDDKGPFEGTPECSRAVIRLFSRFK